MMSLCVKGKEAPPLGGTATPRLVGGSPPKFQPASPLTWAPCATCGSIHTVLDEADVNMDALGEQWHEETFVMKN